MNLNSRRNFLRAAFALTATNLLLPKFVKSEHLVSMPFKDIKKLTPANQGQQFHPWAIVDMHCHPSMKMFLWLEKFWKKHGYPAPGDNILAMQEDSHEFDYGYVRGIVATHYLLEGDIQRQWNTLRILLPFLRHITPKTVDKIEHEDNTNTDQFLRMVDVLEKQLEITNGMKTRFKYSVAKNFDSYRSLLKPGSNIIPVAHAAEGAHALGRNLVFSVDKINEREAYSQNNPNKFLLPNEGKMHALGNDDATEYIRNLRRLIDRGICMVTLSHFFKNDLSHPVEGIAPKQKKLPGFRFNYDPVLNNIGLSVIGKKVVKAMLEFGVVVDLTHSTPAVRQDVYRIRTEVNLQRAAEGKHLRPLIYSHVGSQEVFDLHDNGTYPNYKYYNVDKHEIRELSEQGGVMGVIPEIFWLAGDNKVASIAGHEPFDKRNGIPYIIETMKALNKYTKDRDYDNIAIGTDFDGLADNPKDLFLNKHLIKLFEAMKADAELSQGNRILKITKLNALRVLQAGWGEADQSPLTEIS